MRNFLKLLDTALGDVTLNAQQSAVIGSYFGNGAASFASSSPQIGEGGNINVQISAAGVAPAGTGSDYVLAVYTLPAGCFDQAFRGLNITAMGTIASNTNAKRCKIIFNPTTAVVGQVVSGGTTVADTGVLNTTSAAGGWSLGADIFKYGAAGSNTQQAIHQQAQAGSVVGALVAPSAVTAPENAPILVAITGNAGTTAADILFNFMQIEAMN